MASFAELSAKLAAQGKNVAPAAKPAARKTESTGEMFFHLSIRCWLPAGDSKLGQKVKLGQTKDGRPKIAFAAAPSAYNQDAINGKTGEKGAYLSGDLFSFEATDNGYGDLATDILTRITSDEGRLVDIKAQYKPYQYTTESGEYRTADKWFVCELIEVDSNVDTDDADPQTTSEFDPEFEGIVQEAQQAAEASA
jgi:hypothetical protein